MFWYSYTKHVFKTIRFYLLLVVSVDVHVLRTELISESGTPSSCCLFHPPDCTAQYDTPYLIITFHVVAY